MIKIPKGCSHLTADEAIKSLREEFLSPHEIRMHQACASILETLKDTEQKLLHSKGK